LVVIKRAKLREKVEAEAEVEVETKVEAGRIPERKAKAGNGLVKISASLMQNSFRRGRLKKPRLY